MLLLIVTVLPIGEGIFDVVAGGVYEHSSLVPACTLQPHVLIHTTQTLKLPVANGKSYK